MSDSRKIARADLGAGDEARRARAVAVVRRLREAGYQAYFVGGCVRDELLGRIPKDYDVATDASPEEIARLFPGSEMVGAQFGVMFWNDGREQFQISTFRADGEYRDGRHPESVRFGSLEEDAIRRDFTVNALYLDPETGRVVDRVGGLKDLRQGVLRAIGDPRRRFAEDYLRMMRAVRFATQLEFRIEPETWEAIRTYAPRIREISPERIRDELDLILTSRRPGDGIRLLSASGLLAEILPEVEAMKGVEQPVEFHRGFDVFEHTCRALDELRNPDRTLALAVLLHDVGKPRTRSLEKDRDGKTRIRFFRHDQVGAALAREILARFRYPNRVIEDVTASVAGHMRIKDAPRFRKANLQRLLARRTFPTELELHRIDCKVSHGKMDVYHFLTEALAACRDQPPVPPPLIDGEDLKSLGYEEGPRIGRVLRHLEDLQLEGKIATAEEARELCRRGLHDPDFPPQPVEDPPFHPKHD